ncbi:hypothetical protein NST54_19055 [Caldifermentibacillus hisashii]|uniref:hypothetical protein n=1 Tax=Caldifermentibacillus hisashii TaxID=996558 RepID=UPI0034D53D54
MTTRLFLVTFLSRKTPFFDDETSSRQLFWAKNTIFWRRDSFSSSLLGEKLHFLATRLFLVGTLSRKTHFFDDGTLSRHLFEPENATFWRRDHFSSPFLGEKHHFLTTRLFLVTFLSRKTPFFDDETTSRQLFWAKNTIFWRRDSFSSPLWGKKLTFLATRPLLVVILG